MIPRQASLGKDLENNIWKFNLIEENYRQIIYLSYYPDQRLPAEYIGSSWNVVATMIIIILFGKKEMGMVNSKNM